MVLWLEIGLITPPVGLNLFVIQKLMPGTTARDVTLGTTPYVVLLVALVALLFVFPELALPLPRQTAPRQGDDEPIGAVQTAVRDQGGASSAARHGRLVGGCPLA